MKRQFLIFTTLIVFFTCNIYGQNEKVIPVQVKEKFSEITLTSKDGELVKLPKSDRNTMLIFIRGKVTPTIWCPICHYQYLEMVEAVKETNFAERYDMDIYFVLPYLKDSLQNWINAFPKSLNTINRWKNPENQTEQALAWRDYCKIFFSKDFTFDVENPVLELQM